MAKLASKVKPKIKQTKSMSISEADKQKFHKYLKERENGIKSKAVVTDNNKVKFEDEGNMNPLHWFSKDILLKREQVATQTEENYYLYYQYILAEALSKLNMVLEEDDKQFIEKNITQDNLHKILFLLLDNLDYFNSYIAGALIGYAKLCIQYKLEPEEDFANVSVYLNWLQNKIN